MKCWFLFANAVAETSVSRYFQTCSLFHGTTLFIGGSTANWTLVHSHTLTHPQVFLRQLQRLRREESNLWANGVYCSVVNVPVFEHDM